VRIEQDKLVGWLVGWDMMMMMMIHNDDIHDGAV